MPPKNKTNTSTRISNTITEDIIPFKIPSSTTTPVKAKNSDDIAPGIRKTYEFSANFRNGYADGTVKAARQKLKAEMHVQK